jgi:hypothetical protein
LPASADFYRSSEALLIGPIRKANTPNRESDDGKHHYYRAAGLIAVKMRPAHTPMKVFVWKSAHLSIRNRTFGQVKTF